MNHFLLRSRYKSYFDIIIRNINQRKRTVPSEPFVREKCNWIFCTWYCISNIIKYICDIFVSFYDLWHKFISIKFEIENYKCLHDLTIYHSSCCFWKIKKIEQSGKVYIHLTIYYLTSTSFYLYKYSLKRMFEN